MRIPFTSAQPSTHKRKKAYKIEELLGQGGFGAVHKATRLSDGLECAIKIVPKSSIASLPKQRTRLEALSHFHHDHVVKLYEWFESKEKFYMVFELAAGGELFDHLVDVGRFGEDEAKEVAWALTDALRYLHSMGVVHRDVKLENVLYRTPPGHNGVGHDDCVLSDFGLAAVLETPESKLKIIAGSPGYTAPEVYGNDGYDTAADMWSLGIVVFCTMGGRFPFKETEPRALAYEARTTELYFPSTWADVSSEAKDFVRKLLEVDPKKRLTAEQALHHPWLRTAKSRPPSPIEPPKELPDAIKQVGDAPPTIFTNRTEDYANIERRRTYKHGDDASMLTRRSTYKEDDQVAPLTRDDAVQQARQDVVSNERQQPAVPSLQPRDMQN